jgi:hypothetical protein
MLALVASTSTALVVVLVSLVATALKWAVVATVSVIVDVFDSNLLA